MISDRPAATPALTVLYSFPHAFGAPGIGTTAWFQVRELVRAGHHVTLVAASVARPVEGLRRLVHTLEVGGRRVPHRALGRDRALRHHDRVAARTARRERYDVVHAWPLAAHRTLVAARATGAVGLRECPNTHTANAYAVAARIARELGVAQPARAAHTFSKRHLRTEQREWQAATALLAPSDAVVASFAAQGFAGRVLRHRYGHDLPDGAAPRAVDRPFSAVFLGRGEPRKGLHVALDAWAASAASAGGRLTVHGRIEPAYRAVLAGRLAAPGVVEAGFTADPAAALSEADVLLLPSFEEGSALVTYEAQAAGCVPLVSDAAGAELEHGRHGLVHRAGDTAELTGHIDRLAADADALAALRAHALEHAPRLTWAAAGAVLSDIYFEEVARLRRAPTAADVCVVLCTRDRPAMLRDALGAIRAATPPEVQVLVVDSGSTTPDTRRVAAQAGVDYLRSDVPGLSIARNAGWRATTRDVVVYTDDDCLPASGWVDALLDALRDRRVGAVTGEMVPEDAAQSPPGDPTRVIAPADGLDAGHGALMAFRRNVLQRLGGFDELLGAGRALSGAEDLDMFIRLLADGGAIVHRPDAVVLHANTRHEQDYVRLLAGYGRGLGGMLGKQLRDTPGTAVRVAARVCRRSLRRILTQGSPTIRRRAEIAQLRGVVQGARAVRATAIADGRFVDAMPPAPVPTPMEDAA